MKVISFIRKRWAIKYLVLSFLFLSPLFSDQAERPLGPSDISNKVTLIKVLELGAVKKENNSAFGAISAICVDQNDDIYILDKSSKIITVFDNKGISLRSIGEKAKNYRGLRNPNGLDIDKGNELIVFDYDQISYFSLKGDHIKDIDISTPVQAPKLDDKEHIFACTIIMMSTKSFEGEKKSKLLFSLDKYDLNFNPVQRFATYEDVINPQRINPFPTGLYFAVMKKGNIIWGTSNKYSLTISDSDGVKIKVFNKERNPIKISEEDRNRFIAEHKTSNDIKWEFPEKFPFFRGILADERGRFYVYTFDGYNKNKGFYDIYDSEGKELARLVIDGQIVFIKDDRLYCKNKCENGVSEKVVIYTMKWE